MDNCSQSCCAKGPSIAASVTAVGKPLQTSIAKLGPDRAASSTWGASSLITSLMNLCVSRSMPLAQFTKAAPLRRNGRAHRTTARIACAGTTPSTISASTNSSRSLVGATAVARGNPGRWRRFSRSRANAAIWATSCPHNATRPRPDAATLARATPHAPAPSTKVRARFI